MSVPVGFGREIAGDLPQARRREWLVTNGIGGYGAGTVAGCATRRYHGLLVAALLPPVGRTVLLTDLDVNVETDGGRYELACHEYSDGTVHPSGHTLLQAFRLEGSVPTWTYALGAVLIEKQIFMRRGANTTHVRFTIVRAPGPVALTIRPLCTRRDYHWERRGGGGFATKSLERSCVVTADGAEPALTLSADAGRFTAAPETHWNIHHREEAARGLDADEDLHGPGYFDIVLEPGATLAITASTEARPGSAGEALEELRAHEQSLLGRVAGARPAWIDQLILTADQFIVGRSTNGEQGRTVIAGYPWFSDWGRDTMIALPGLTLTTGRVPVAAEILRTFAGVLSEGMLPNRFPDGGEAPEYNTVDATLWYVVAVHDYVTATDDVAFLRELYPVLLDIIDWHQRGTRHGIGVDPADGLLRAGVAGVQLTWMDAKVGDWVVTPRIGKPVEINALWCNVLLIAADFAGRLRDVPRGLALRAAGATAQTAFAARFWHAPGGYLYDVVDGPDGTADDASLRPNQLLALALPHRLLDAARAASVLAVCERELLTSLGLRTLDRNNPSYVGRYGGDQRQRDGAYHQGTVWPWLIGTFVRAHLAVHGDPDRARAYLEPFEHHLTDTGLGQISEIFDADPPHLPNGCFAQAWSVSEILRAWFDLAPAADASLTPTRAKRSGRSLTRSTK
jgi:predicted glycogen debranching enzyme